MSVSVDVGPWADDAKGVPVCDSELRLCLDRSDDSDSQLELNRSLSELIDSITYNSGDEARSEGGGHAVVADIVERILDRVEETTGSGSGAPPRLAAQLPPAREIDGDTSRDESRHRRTDSPKKERRKRDRSEKKRRRSTSCSTTSSACSDVSRKHKRRHKHHRRREEDPGPRVNPIFLWVKQDDTRIVEVLCEDYDKRNRIRLTKTAQGWRAMPRTERLDSALSRSSLDLDGPPTLVKQEPPTDQEPEPELHETKDKKRRCVSRKNKRCDKKHNGFKNENNCVDKNAYVDVVNNNNNNASVSNNNKVKSEHSLVSESTLSEPRLRSFGYKKACHEILDVTSKNKKKDNKNIDDIDIYTFVPTPKTDSEDNVKDLDSNIATALHENHLKIKSEPVFQDIEPEVGTSDMYFENLNIKVEPNVSECTEDVNIVNSQSNSSIYEATVSIASKIEKNTLQEVTSEFTKGTESNSQLCKLKRDIKIDDLHIKPTKCPESERDTQNYDLDGKQSSYPESERDTQNYDLDGKQSSYPESEPVTKIDNNVKQTTLSENEPEIDDLNVKQATCSESEPGTKTDTISLKQTTFPNNEPGQNIGLDIIIVKQTTRPDSLGDRKENELSSPERRIEPVANVIDVNKSVHTNVLEVRKQDYLTQDDQVKENRIPNEADDLSCNSLVTDDDLQGDSEENEGQNIPEQTHCLEPQVDQEDEHKLREPQISKNVSNIPEVTCNDKRRMDDINEPCEEEEDEDENHLSGVILPEPHLSTPEPSPQPVPEPSVVEPDSILTEISLQPDTSLDSDTINLPDTTSKSDTSLLISTDITLGQKLSIKPHPDIDSSLLPESLRSDSKSIDDAPVSTPQSDRITAEMIREAEIERQITADLDEDHLLAIEEILQGEECVEEFDDDDLPEEYPVTHESPVNLVVDLKAKDQIDHTGIPLSLRTYDFLEIFPTTVSSKDQPEALSLTAPAKKPSTVEKTIPPAHQQSKTKFLESMLSYPKRCHVDSNKKADSSDQQEPLYLGVSRKSASPTVSSSDGRKFSSPELEPKPKRMKVEDITLKTILNRNKDNNFPKAKVNKSKDSEEIQQTADSTTKSRLLELLTNENDEHINKLDPLTQLKEILSDPDLNVPDPLLVPRARLQALVTNPAKEIPRLLAMKSENLYPKLLTDPDLLVVSLSHLQSLLQSAGKEEEMLKYQQHAQLLQQQMKQDQSNLDAATATALNQMMWLPYLSQLEAAAMACGNTQDFMAMLNMVFPSGTYPQMNPYMMTSPSSGINAYDYKSQLEFQQAFALWNEAMMQAATNQFAAQSLGTANNNSNNNNNNISKLYQNYQDTKLNSKPSHSNALSGKTQDTKHTSARTSPISLNYPQNKYRSNQYPYTSMFSIPTSTPTTSYASGSANPYRTTPSSQSQHAYQSSRQRNYNYNNYSSLRPPTVTTTPSVPKTEPTVRAVNTSDLYKAQQKHSGYSSSAGSNCRSLMNILSKPKQSEVKSHSSKVFPTSTTMLPRETTVRLTTPSVKQEPPKLKVKQPQHLVDPNSRPKLLNFDEHGEVGSTTGSLTPQADEAHPSLWHPLFSSHQQKSYTSPWQWTTPVTVAGE